MSVHARLAVGLLLAAPAVCGAEMLGPIYDAPHGNVFAESGNIGRVGGLVYTYSDHHAVDVDAGLYYGRSTLYTVQLSMDGGDFTGAETLSFSGLLGNVATWEGSSTIRVRSGSIFVPVAVDTRFTLTAADLGGSPIDFIPPASVGVTSDAEAIFPVASSFNVTLLFEANHDQGWEPVLDLFDRVENDPSTFVSSSVDTAYYANVCACEWNLVPGVDIFDLLAYLADWFGGDAAANLDAIPEVDIFDLLAFLSCWFTASAGDCP